MADSQIVACGGFPLGTALDDYVFAAARGSKICAVPTAQMEDESGLLRFYELFAPRTDASHVVFNPWPRADLRDFVLSQDIVLVFGGNTANMLALWRVHGFDEILRDAWQAGVLMYGWSAGMICWFEAGVTDSFGPQLEGMRDGLGFLRGSACPHYDGEELRRPRYRELVDGGFPPGYAADDGAALHFVDTELVEVVSARDGATAYRVEPASETALEARTL